MGGQRLEPIPFLYTHSVTQLIKNKQKSIFIYKFPPLKNPEN